MQYYSQKWADGKLNVFDAAVALVRLHDSCEPGDGDDVEGLVSETS